MSGVDGAEAGIFMTPHPHPGRRTTRRTTPGTPRTSSPSYAAAPTWSSRCMDTQHALLTRETTALEPGVVDHKYYVRDIGTVRELTVKGGSESLRLVGRDAPPAPLTPVSRLSRRRRAGGTPRSDPG